MRVISGKAKGSKLISAVGGETRPTADRIKESIFNIIQFEIEGRRILDLFAGTGQMAIEALSRGAREAVLIDMSSAAIKTIHRNLEHTKLSSNAKVIGGEALHYMSGVREKFDVIFLDPPYDTVLLTKAVKKAVEFDILEEGGIMVCECPAGYQPPLVQLPYKMGKEYHYGSKKVVVYYKTEVGAEYGKAEDFPKDATSFHGGAESYEDRNMPGEL